MLLSRKWLTEFADISAPDKEFADAMTMSGSKVETITEPGGEISRVVVGRIVSMERHPDSDHLWVCLADVGGDEPVQICTGAWNIHVGDLVPVALDGSTLPGGVRIEAGMLRGEASNGMFCSLSELGLDERDFPYAVITAAALLNDYHPLDKENPSVPPDLGPGGKVAGPLIAARVESVESDGLQWRVTLDTGNSETAETVTPCANLHEGDLCIYDPAAGHICTLADIHADQKEFPHCIEDGIFVLHEEGIRPGDDIRPVINADDHVVDFEITPNRPDCLSVIGLAREAAATFNVPLMLHEPVVHGGAEGDLNELLHVETPAADLVPRYNARMVRNVHIAPSPKWMRERLRSMGVRPINNIVDITNYVMLEYGQPMHAFDYRYVSGGTIIVRRAEPGEELTTLDGNVRKLNSDHLVIADRPRAVGLAGIMGGMNSEIKEDTTDVVFESACFDATCIRRGAAALGMRTEASAKNEKGLNPMNTLPAVQRACELVEMLGAGEVVDGIVDIQNFIPVPTVLPLDEKKINALLGTDIPEVRMEEILRRLDFTVENGLVTVPSWRADVERTCDLAEEVARYYGYNNIPSTLMRGETTLGGYQPAQLLERQLGSLCRAAGYSEIITYSFISPSFYDKIGWSPEDPRRRSFVILNPLGEDTSIMRTTTLPSMLEVLQRNFSFRNQAVRLYEVGRTYLPGEEENTGLGTEPKVLTLGAYGDDMDFYALKGVVEMILTDLRTEDVHFVACGDNPSYHPGRCAKTYSGDRLLGVFGQLHPEIARNYGLEEEEIYCAELSFDALEETRGGQIEYTPLPRYPAATRDLCVVCDEAVTAAQLETCIRAGGGGLLEACGLFDIYRGEGVPEGKKSMAFNLTLRSPERSLTAAEADDIMAGILEKLQTELGAVLR